MIAPGEGPQQQGEYKIRPYSEPPDLLYQLPLRSGQAPRNPGREMGVSLDFIQATTAEGVLTFDSL